MTEKLKGCMMHTHDNWATPKNLYEKLIKQGFRYPCELNADYNGLEINYFNEKIFINPPFSKMTNWVDYAIKQYKHNKIVLLLIPARTDTKYFHKLLKEKPMIIFIEGRLHYNESKNGAPFPTILIALSNFNIIPTYTNMTLEQLENWIK